MTRKKGSPKNPKAVAAGKKAWAKMSPAKKAAAKTRLARFRFTKGGGTSPAASSRPASTPAPRGGTTGDKPKRKKPDPIPVIGVRGSSTKVSAVKVAGVAGAASVLLIAPRGHNVPALHSSRDFEGVATVAQRRASEIWNRYGTKILIVGGAIALFGKAFDRRYKDFPVRLGH